MPVALTCENCGEGYTLPPSKAEKSRYCSSDCKYADQVERVTLTCDQCSGEFELRPCYAEGRRYCGRACRDDARRQWVELTCEWCGTTREYQRYRVDEFSYCSDACKMDAARASRFGHGTPVEQVEQAIENADEPLTRDELTEAVVTNIAAAIDHAIDRLDIEVTSAPETRLVAALRADGPLTYSELRSRMGGPCQVPLERLKNAHVVVHLGEACGGYHLVESLPPALQPMNWSPPEWASPSAAAAKAEGD